MVGRLNILVFRRQRECNHGHSHSGGFPETPTPTKTTHTSGKYQATLGLTAGSVAVFQELCKETIGNCWEAGIAPCCCAAIAVLWLALAPERFPLQADTFSRAAGTVLLEKWSLILPSSARVSELTYVTIIGTRYPELDQFHNDIIQFGNYLQAEQCTRGGFLPIFWDAPFSYINASTDSGEVVDWITDKFVVANKGDLAVLHNRNKMVNVFTNTEWVSGSGGAVISRSVTSCAGMTAYLVLLAQTRVGFLSGGGGKSFISFHHKNRLPREKKPMQGPLWPSPEHNKSALSWAR